MTEEAKTISQVQTANDLIDVCELDNLRYLNINHIEQSRIDINHPEQLISPLHLSFLSSLLFIPLPQKVLLGGLGGGALARYLHYIRPEIKGCAIEINEAIASLAKDYFFFPDKHWRLIIGDIQEYDKDSYDLILLDIAENDLTPDWVCGERMLRQLKEQLTENGVLAINLLVTDAKSFNDKLTMIRTVFKRKTLCVSVPDHKNIVVFAFKARPEYSEKEQLELRVDYLTGLCGFDFSVLLNQLYKDNPKGSGII